MSAPKKIWIIANGGGDVGMFDDEAHQKQMLESVQFHNGDYDGPYSMEPYVHASELEAVQARLDALVKVATDMLNDLYDCGLDECAEELKAAIRAAKGE